MVIRYFKDKVPPDSERAPQHILDQYEVAPASLNYPVQISVQQIRPNNSTI